MQTLLGIDLGTSGVKALLMTPAGQVMPTSTREYLCAAQTNLG
ncbi:MAG: hypothetical protein ACLQUY_11190 [Ktedonobacterales bacterium]